MQEALLQYIWKNSLFNKKTYRTDSGESITIIHPGIQNTDGGPDFTDARIKIDDTTWAGNVELHKNASEWYLHNHHTDRAYNNVILHVVIHADKICIDANGRRIPSITLEFNEGIEKRYKRLITDPSPIPCRKNLFKLDLNLISFWLSALTIERLQLKISEIQEILSLTKNNWEEAFYIQLATSFGLKINTLPFELIAKSIPLKILTHYSDNLLLTESLFFGQAGFLDGEIKDRYYEILKKEYHFLKKKHSLIPIENHLWKFLRLRPSNFPTVRIAQFCALMYKSKSLFSSTVECESTDQLLCLYECQVSEYWENHFTFGKQSEKSKKKLGKNTVNSIIINTIVPFMYIYGKNKNHSEIQEKALRFLEYLAPENNYITRKWIQCGIPVRNAFESQALIQLLTRYCREKRCIECQIGHLILKG
jgi:hypothetical protein